MTNQEQILEEFENLLPVKAHFNLKEPIYGEENRRDLEFIKSFLLQALFTAKRETLKDVLYQFRKTEEMQHADEIHCGCLGYAEKLIEALLQEEPNKEKI